MLYHKPIYIPLFSHHISSNSHSSVNVYHKTTHFKSSVFVIHQSQATCHNWPFIYTLQSNMNPSTPSIRDSLLHKHQFIVQLGQIHETAQEGPELPQDGPLELSEQHVRRLQWRQHQRLVEVPQRNDEGHMWSGYPRFRWAYRHWPPG